MGVHIAKRGAVTMTTVVQEVASVTSLGRDAPECHLSDKFNPEISVSNVHTHTHTTQMCVCVCVQSVVIACRNSWTVLSWLPRQFQ